MSPSIVALIPARAGSKRIPGKNTRLLGDVPLLAWTIAAAQESGIFTQVIVSSEDASTRAISYDYGATPFIRRRGFEDDAPDIVWVSECLPACDAFAILRPTSPFRTAETIRRAWCEFQERQPGDSLRAVEPVRQHPMKMWYPRKDEPGLMAPALPGYMGPNMTESWSSPTQTLPPYYVQNASLEIAWTKTVRRLHSISGERVAAFLTEGYEGFDLNTEEDWKRAEELVTCGLVTLPSLSAEVLVQSQKD